MRWLYLWHEARCVQLQWVVSVQVRERERGGTPVIGDDSQLLTERLIDRLKKKKS